MDKYIIYGLDYRQEITILAEEFEADYEIKRVRFMDNHRETIALFNLERIQGFVNMSKIERGLMN